MNLAEMLEHTSKDVLDDRTTLIDGEDDSLYPDTLLVRYFNEAANRLCRRSWAIIDIGNVDAGVIALQTGVATYALHPAVLRVLGVRPSDQQYSIRNFDEEALTASRPYDVSNWPDIDNAAVAAAGRPLGYSTETGTRLLRVVRTPSAVETAANLQLILRVARLPIVPLTVDNMDGVPETPDEYTLWLCDYAAGKCLTQPNVDEDHKAEGRRLLDEFEVHVREARQDRERAAMTDTAWVYASSTAQVH